MSRLGESDELEKWILEQVVMKGQMENGSHPERYLKFPRCRITRRRRPRPPRPPKPFLPIPPTAKMDNTYWSPAPLYMEITLDEIKAEVEEIFCIRERVREQKRRAWKPPLKTFLRGGWKNFYAPENYRIPRTPRPMHVPIGYFTLYEQEIRAKLDAEMKRRRPPDFLSKAYRYQLKKLGSYWVRELFPAYRRSPPLYFIRLSDFNENGDRDFSKKNYEYPLKHSRPKTKIPKLYESCVYSLFAKMLNIRRYELNFGDGYRYRTTSLILRDAFPFWKPKHIDNARRKFLEFDPYLNGFIGFETMCVILDRLKNRSSMEIRRYGFDFFVKNEYTSHLMPNDMIEFEEFLKVYYNLKYAKRSRRKFLKNRAKTKGPRYPWSRKLKIKDDGKIMRELPVSFRKGTQYIATAVGSSAAWNIACGMF